MLISRNNGDDGIKYLVNDSKLDVTTLKDKNVVVVGERHGNASDEKLVRELIAVMNPSIVLCEALGDLSLPTEKDKKAALDKDEKYFYYQGFTKHWIEIALEFPETAFLGIEYTKWTKKEHDNMTHADSFAIREEHWLRLIKKHMAYGKVLVVIGDTHLRTIKTKQLGPASPIYTSFIRSDKAAIVRSQQGEIE